jgi:hypothetical protein
MFIKISSITLILLVLIGCSSKESASPILIGGQFISCDHFINLDKVKANDLDMPVNFQITPRMALRIVKEKTEFNCHHKMGAQIYADDRFYYFVRIGTGTTLNISRALTSVRVIVDGKDGSYWVMRYFR